MPVASAAQVGPAGEAIGTVLAIVTVTVIVLVIIYY